MNFSADGEGLKDGLCVQVLDIDGQLNGIAYRKKCVCVFHKGQDLSVATSGDRASRHNKTYLQEMSSLLHGTLQEIPTEEVANFGDNIWLREQCYTMSHEVFINFAVHYRLGQWKKKHRMFDNALSSQIRSEYSLVLDKRSMSQPRSRPRPYSIVSIG